MQIFENTQGWVGRMIGLSFILAFSCGSFRANLAMELDVENGNESMTTFGVVRWPLRPGTIDITMFEEAQIFMV